MLRGSAYALIVASMIGGLAREAAARPSKPVQGGAAQRTSVQGCMNQFLFDGVWRLKVLSVAKGTFTSDGDTGYAVKMQLRNGTSKEREVKYTGFGGTRNAHINLVMSDDTSVSVQTLGSYLTDFNTFITTSVPPGAAVNVTLKFVLAKDALTGSATPKKLLVEVDPKTIFPDYADLHYPIADPSFRVFLNCTKSS
jgi:hypothetical protein